MTTKTIAITGATGQFGAIALNLLKAKQANVIALVRSPEKISGVEARKFDYSKTEGQVEALQGVDTLILVSSSEVGQRALQHNNVIESAKKAGVKHIIYTSLLGATNDNTVKSLAGEHIETEAALKASDITYTILRNGWYTENYTASIPAALANNAFYGSAKNGKISSVLRAELAEAGLDEGFAGLIAHWDVDASNGALFSEDKTLEKLLGRPTAGLDVAVKQALAH